MIEGGNEGLPIQERKSEKGEQPDMTGAQRDCEETSWKGKVDCQNMFI